MHRGDLAQDWNLPRTRRRSAPITALALAAVDTALWDLRAKKQNLPLWKLAGGAKDRCPLYTTEGGWLHIEKEALVDDALQAKAKGFSGSKVKIGKPHGSEDYDRLVGGARGARRRLRDHDRLQSGLYRRRGHPPCRAA